MKKILLLHDEARRPTHLLQNAVPARGAIGECETVAACNCDRWGHPCPGFVEHIAQPAGASDFNAHEEMR
jgi:hypothetical protein